MPTIKGLFDYFIKFEEIDITDLQKWLPSKEDYTILENRFGNRILYPQVVPQTIGDLLFDFAIIRKIIEQNQTKFYNKNLKRIDIPEVFLEHFPDLQSLVGVIIDVIQPLGITTFWIKSNEFGSNSLGTYIKPENLEKGGLITIGIKGQLYQIKVGSLMIIPITESRVDIIFSSSSAKLMGKKNFSVEVVTGRLGLIIDARI